MSAAYDQAAEIYLASGLCPIPVAGKFPPVVGATGYRGTVTLGKINEWLHSDPAVRERAGRYEGMDSVAHRHRKTLSIDVDEGYGGKDGVAQLAAFARANDLRPLPPTWSSTARGNRSPSRQYVYLVPKDVPFRTKPCRSVELCSWHHRYTVCAPSIHPDAGTSYSWYLSGAEGVPPTWGERTDRYPTMRDFAELPNDWFEAFSSRNLNGNSGADEPVTTVQVLALLDSFREGQPDARVQHEIDKWANLDNHLGHDETKNALITAFMLGREKHAGVRELYELIISRFSDYVAQARPRQARRELASLIEACSEIAQRRPLAFERCRIGRADSVDMAIDDSLASDIELDSWLNTFTEARDEIRLVRRLEWMISDPPGSLRRHALHLVAEAIAGDYASERAAQALGLAWRHHRGPNDTAGARRLLASTLGYVLSSSEGQGGA